MNIKQQDVSFWSQKAESFMQQKAQGKNTLSVQDVASLFMKEGNMHIDSSVIERIAGEDKQVNKNELAMLLYMLDGTKKYDANDKSQYWVEHDWFIESNVYKHKGVRCGDEIDDSLKDTLANTATPEEFAEIQKAFGIQGKPQFGLNAEPSQTSEKVGIMKTIRDEEYQARLESDVDKILNGKSSIKLSEFQKTPIYKSIQQKLENTLHEIDIDDIATYEDRATMSDNVHTTSNGTIIIEEDSIEISRDELKTILMVADANLVEINGEQKFVFDSDYTNGEHGGFIEMTPDEKMQIFGLMKMRSLEGAEVVNTFVEEHLPPIQP